MVSLEFENFNVEEPSNQEIPSDKTDDLLHTHRWTVTGLTAGNTYNYWLGAKVSSGSKNLRWGGNSADEYGSFVMKVTALPQATVAFAQYG